MTDPTIPPVPADDEPMDHRSLDYLLSRAEITDVLHQNARGIDRKDWELLRTSFHEDGFDNHGSYQGGPEGLAAWIRERHETIPHRLHSLGNIVIEFASSTRAVVESSCLGLTGDSGPSFELLVVRYVDVFERREGVGWRILRRAVVWDFGGRVDIDAHSPSRYADYVRARRDGDDELWRVRRSQGLPGLGE